MKEQRNYLLSELKKLGISSNAKQVPIEQLDYESLKSMLAVKTATLQ